MADTDESGTSGIDLALRITDFTAALDADGGYRPPGRAERTSVAEGVGLLLDGRTGAARRRLADVDYGVRTLTDRATGRRYAEVADYAGSGGATRGWGRVYVDLGTKPAWSVQVPHPGSDARTERLGAEVLRAARGGVLVLAGAHRRAGDGDAADGAHRRDTVFDAVCTELARRGLPGIQVHGMADATMPGTDMVVSTGRSRAAGLPVARSAARALTGKGFAVCRAWARSCRLEARDNVQGRRAAALRVPFVHVECSRRVRDDGRLLRRTAEALGGTAREAGREPGRG